MVPRDPLGAHGVGPRRSHAERWYSNESMVQGSVRAAITPEVAVGSNIRIRRMAPPGFELVNGLKRRRLPQEGA